MISAGELAPNEDLLAHALGQADSSDGRWGELMAAEWFGLFDPHRCEAAHKHLADALTQGHLPAAAVIDEMSTFQLREFVLHCHHEAAGGDIEPKDWERWAGEARIALEARLAQMMFSRSDHQAGCRLAKEWGSHQKRGLGWLGARRRWRKGSAYPASLGIHGVDEVAGWLAAGRNRGVRYVNACAALGVELPALRAYARQRMSQLAGREDQASPAGRVLDAGRMVLRAPGASIPEFGGRFQVLDELGHGGYGRVFVARDTWPDRFSRGAESRADDPRFCALKLTPSGDPRRASSLWEEAEALRRAPRLRSIPAFVALIEGRYQGAPHLGLAEEWVRGPTLAYLLEGVRGRRWRGSGSRMPRGWIPLRWIDRWMFDLREALAWSRKAGFMHGDIKPENIVIEPDTLRAVLVDWGAFRPAGTLGPYTGGYVHPSGRDSKRQDGYQLALLFNELMVARPRSTAVFAQPAAGRDFGAHRLLAIDDRELEDARWRVSHAPSPWAGMFERDLESLSGRAAPAPEVSTGTREVPPEWRLPQVALWFSEPDSSPQRRRSADERWHPLRQGHRR